MERLLSKDEARQLMELLKLDMEKYGDIPTMRKAYLRRCKELHPDKGGDENLMKKLNELYRKLESGLADLSEQPGTSSAEPKFPKYGTPEWEQWWKDFNKTWDDDLRCDEEMPSSDEEMPHSQATPPKKKQKTADAPKDFPPEIKEFLSNAIFSNKTLNCFVLYTTKEKAVLLYRKVMDKFQTFFISRHGYEEAYSILFFLTLNRHRVSAINNFCRRLCTVSFLLCKGVLREYFCYSALTRPPFTVLQESVPGGLMENDFKPCDDDEAKMVSWKMVSEYALAIRCEDLHLLLGLYLEFEVEPEKCEKCDKKQHPDHFEHHAKHHENACLFSESKNQKGICGQAIDAVIAKKRVDAMVMTRAELLAERFMYHFRKMDIMFGSKGTSVIEHYMAGVAWFQVLFPGVEKFIMEYLKAIVLNMPKRRYFLFMGPVDTGKTTLAAALLDLCGGKALNINLPFERINFELGMAIDQFTVVFEDVKGTGGETKDLPSGTGVSNLDSLRDYMDGSVKVNLEKKHLNKRTQIFPPGLVTMNEYHLPITLRARFVRTLRFVRKDYLRRSLKNTPELLQQRILQSGITLLFMLLWHEPVESFHKSIHSEVVKWKELLDIEISLSRYDEMVKNVQNGVDILKRETDPPSPPESMEDSGVGTESQEPNLSQQM
ncbi:large T antigen [Betapolyomavirus equi]|uniref:Large T antigen n=1 Tax=Betapolyomavirus equi TaxID=1891761 RepID=I3QJF1_9POLY|nr:large T antigen [Betapolyomavirus equi]AFK09341.1 large T antigen [Betapolyomavirus equi]